MNQVYQIVTDRIVEAIKAGGVLPWHRPWKATDTACKSYHGYEYRGINVFLALLSGRPGPWITLKQCHKVGGRVKDGEFNKCQIVTFFKFQDKADRDNPEKSYRAPIFRFYKVWSLDQCEGVPEPGWLKKEKAAQNGPSPALDTLQACEALWQGYKGQPPVTYGGNRACYIPARDEINMPQREGFESAEEFYSVLFHEGVHSTGHSKRLARKDADKPAPFGSEDYSREELVAEVGAAMLCAVAGIERKTINNSIGYVHNWLMRLECEPMLIVQAAGQAQKACDHIRGTTFDNDSSDD
jgi:antirestriction protein ArdC